MVSRMLIMNGVSVVVAEWRENGRRVEQTAWEGKEMKAESEAADVRVEAPIPLPHPWLSSAPFPFFAALPRASPKRRHEY